MKNLVALTFATLLILNPKTMSAQTDQPAGTPFRAISKNVDVNEAEKLVKEKKAVVLDIRKPDEFKSGHIAGATNIDFYAADFEKQIAALDKNKPYLVHCAAGGRSGKSLETFKKLNFQIIYHLDAGFNGWKSAGKPVEK